MKYQDHKLEIISLVLALFIGVSIWFGIMPLWNKIRTKANDLQAFLLDQKNSQSLLLQMPKLKKEKKMIDEHRDELEIFFDKNQALTLAEEIEKIAKETNNEVIIKANKEESVTKKTSSKNKKSSSKNEKVKVAPSLDNYLLVTVKLKGTKENAIAFIRKMSSISYLFTILNVTISQQEDTAFEKNNDILKEKENNAYFKKVPEPNLSKTESSEPVSSSSEQEEEQLNIYYTTLKIAFYTRDNLHKKLFL